MNARSRISIWIFLAAQLGSHAQDAGANCSIFEAGNCLEEVIPWMLIEDISSAESAEDCRDNCNDTHKFVSHFADTDVCVPFNSSFDPNDWHIGDDGTCVYLPRAGEQCTLYEPRYCHADSIDWVHSSTTEDTIGDCHSVCDGSTQHLYFNYNTGGGCIIYNSSFVPAEWISRDDGTCYYRPGGMCTQFETSSCIASIEIFPWWSGIDIEVETADQCRTRCSDSPAMYFHYDPAEPDSVPICIWYNLSFDPTQWIDRDDSTCEFLPEGPCTELDAGNCSHELNPWISESVAATSLEDCSRQCGSLPSKVFSYDASFDSDNCFMYIAPLDPTEWSTLDNGTCVHPGGPPTRSPTPMPPTPFPSPLQVCSQMPGVELNAAFHLISNDVLTAEDCCDVCLLESGCGAFTWNGDTRQCSTFQPDSISGTSGCASCVSGNMTYVTPSPTRVPTPSVIPQSSPPPNSSDTATALSTASRAAMEPGAIAAIVIGVLLFAALCGAAAWRFTNLCAWVRARPRARPVTILRAWVRRRIATASAAGLTEARPVVVPESFTSDDIRLRDGSQKRERDLLKKRERDRERDLWAHRGGREREMSEVDDVVLAEASELYTVTPTFRTLNELSRRKTNLYESDDDVIQAEASVTMFSSYDTTKTPSFHPRRRLEKLPEKTPSMTFREPEENLYRVELNHVKKKRLASASAVLNKTRGKALPGVADMRRVKTTAATLPRAKDPVKDADNLNEDGEVTKGEDSTGERVYTHKPKKPTTTSSSKATMSRLDISEDSENLGSSVPDAAPAEAANEPVVDDECGLPMASRKSRKCEICGEVFGKFLALVEHMKDAHNKIVGFSCPICKKVFTTKHNMQVHTRTHRFTQVERDGSMKAGVPLYSCDYCDETFIQKSNWKRHKLVRHEQPGKCPLCPMRFSSEDDFEVHARDKHPHEKGLKLRIRQVSLRCQCQQLFTTLIELKAHRGECDQAFRSQSAAGNGNPPTGRGLDLAPPKWSESRDDASSGSAPSAEAPSRSAPPPYDPTGQDPTGQDPTGQDLPRMGGVVSFDSRRADADRTAKSSQPSSSVNAPATSSHCGQPLIPPHDANVLPPSIQPSALVPQLAVSSQPLFPSDSMPQSSHSHAPQNYSDQSHIPITQDVAISVSLPRADSQSDSNSSPGFNAIVPFAVDAAAAMQPSLSRITAPKRSLPPTPTGGSYSQDSSRSPSVTQPQIGTLPDGLHDGLAGAYLDQRLDRKLMRDNRGYTAQAHALPELSRRDSESASGGFDSDAVLLMGTSPRFTDPSMDGVLSDQR